MSSNITFYLDPEFVDQPFHWEGADIYRFVNHLASDIVCGSTMLGKKLLESLDKNEQDLITPKGHKQEQQLPLVEPRVLKQILLKVYALIAQQLLYNPNVKELLRDGVRPNDLFHKMQRDIAGAVLICERAIEKECQVYVALW